MLSNDSDADGDPLRIKFIDDWTNGTARFDHSSGQITFIPAPGFVGEAQFSYLISDGNENGYAGLGFARVLIDVHEYTEPVSENSAPSVVNDAFSVMAGETLTITSAQLLDNDFDLDGDRLRILFIDDWEHGNARFDQAGGSITFTPDDGFTGEARFTYIVSDGHEDGYDGLGFGFVKIDVVEEPATNHPPVANPDQFAGTENTILVINESDMLSNDIESDPQDSLSISSVAGGDNGTVLFDYTRRQVTFTPETDFTGTASFSYTVVDRFGTSAVASVSVVIRADQPPEVTPAADKFRTALSNQSLMGMNMNGAVYYSPQYYKDLMRVADPWKSSDATGTRWENDIYFDQIPKRADGYPTHVPFNVIGTDLEQVVETPISAGNRENTGLYHVLYQGTGEFDLLGATFVSQPQSGHRIYDFGNEPGSTKVLRISRSDIADPLHGIAIVHEDDLATYQNQPFHEHLASSFDDVSVVRLMDMMFTNGNAAQTATNITPVDYYTWNDCPGGVCDATHFAGHPPQVLMKLMNYLDVNPWLTFPHQADDGFLRQYAQAVYDNLDADKYVFVEYSNELWNWMFPQAQWIGVVGCEDPVTRINLDNGDCDVETSARRYQTKRSLEIFDIVKDVFGEDSHRVITVLAGQGNWSYRTQLSVEALNDPNINPDNASFDVLAIAPYFGGEPIATQESRDFFVNATFDELRAMSVELIDSDEVRGGVREHKALANQYGMELLAYEGGQHFLCGAAYCDDTILMDKLTQFQRHDVMEEIYNDYYDMWFSEGGSLFSVFSHIVPADSRWGAWGTLEYYGQALAETPKRRALQAATERYRMPASGSDPEPGNGSGSGEPPATPIATRLRTYIFGHSLILHATDSTETTVPHWMNELAEAAGYSYRFSGQYGFLPQHANLPPYPQWGFEHIPSIWDDDSGLSFADVNFDSVMITAANFVQYQGPTVPYDGDNPGNSTPISATLDIIDWVRAQEPGIRIYIYENWQDMMVDFPPTDEQLASYHTETVNASEGGFHRWWLDYHDALTQARPDADIKMIPIGPIISRLLTKSPLDAIEVTDLYEDNAPHGRPTIYFLASLVSYMAMYGEKPPLSFTVPDSIHPLVRGHYQAIVDDIWLQLESFNFEDDSSRVW